MSRNIDNTRPGSEPPSASTPTPSSTSATNASSSASSISRRGKSSSLRKRTVTRQSHGYKSPYPPNHKLLDCLVEGGGSYDSPAFLVYCVCLTDQELYRLTGKRLRPSSKSKHTFTLAGCPGYQQEIVECYARPGLLDDARGNSKKSRFPGFSTYTNSVFPPAHRPVYLVIARLPTEALWTIGGQQAGMDVEARMVEDMDVAGCAKTLERMGETLVEARKACAAIIERWPQDPRPMVFSWDN